MGIRHTVPALLALALVAGCASAGVTQLIVVVDTDLRMPSEIDRLAIAVTGPSHMAIDQRAALTGRETLPFTLTVVPAGEALGPVDIVVSATLGASTTAVVTRRASVTLVRNETRVVILHLVRSCVGVTCAASGETCTEMGCSRIDMTPLYAWSGVPPRLREDAGSAIDAGRDTGPIDLGVRDASVDAPLDAPIYVDSGPDCSTMVCNDMNPCTDDVCNPMTHSCDFRPVDIACDDGVFCNGFDHCAAGVCATHTGNPCLGATVCDEARRGCTGCTTDASCPAGMTSGWGACGGFADGCGNGGSHTRLVRTFACVSDVCVGSERMESESCAVDRTGTSCMPTTCSGFGGCGDGAGGTCGTSGIASRTCVDHTCAAGACGSTSRSETTTCARATDGLSCGGASCGGWGGCTNDGSCTNSGSHSRSCTTPTCAGGSCTNVGSTESEGCFFGTDGNACGAPSCDAWSACSYPDACATTGSQSRNCANPVCSGGSCSGGGRIELGACGGRTTDGDICGGPSCSGWACTGGLADYECDQDGFLQRTCQDTVCGGGSCGTLSAPRVEDGGACTISTDGNSCWGGGCFVCISGGCTYVC